MTKPLTPEQWAQKRESKIGRRGYRKTANPYKAGTPVMLACALLYPDVRDAGGAPGLDLLTHDQWKAVVSHAKAAMVRAGTWPTSIEEQRHAADTTDREEWRSRNRRRSERDRRERQQQRRSA